MPLGGEKTLDLLKRGVKSRTAGDIRGGASTAAPVYNVLGGQLPLLVPGPWDDPVAMTAPPESLMVNGNGLSQHKQIAMGIDGLAPNKPGGVANNQMAHPQDGSALPAQVIDKAEMDRIENALISVLKTNTDNAIGLSFDMKQNWFIYRDMGDGKCPIDEPNSPLVKMGYYQPLIAKYEEQRRALLIQSIMTDPSRQDWFELEAGNLWTGMEMLSDALTEQLRSKYARMRPQDAENFLGFLNIELKDRHDLGNAFSLTTHEVLSDPSVAGNPNGLIEGATHQWKDPFNVFPWREDVNCITDTFVSIWEPFTRDEAIQMNFVNLDQLLESETDTPVSRRYLNYRNYSSSWNREDPYTTYSMKMYPAWLGIGRFPFQQLQEQLGDEKPVDDSQDPKQQFAIDFQMLMINLGSKYGFDGSTVTPDSWFYMQWCGTTLLECAPYQLDLPVGEGPLLHEKFYRRPGHLWGDGLYDRIGWDERFYNQLQRAVMTITMFTSKGLFGYRKNIVDPEYLQLHGDQPSFSPGDYVPIDDRQSPGSKLFEKYETNEAAIPLIREHQNALTSEMQMLCGMYDDLQGQSNSRTATQASQNLQTGMALIEFDATLLSNGMLKNLVSRAYVITRQMAMITGYVPPVSISSEEGMLQQVQMQPGDIVSLNFIEIRMTGRTSPANKANQMNSFTALMDMFMPTGIVSIADAFKLGLKIAALPGTESLVFRPDPQMVNMAMQNLSTVAGPMALQWLPPAMQQTFGMMMNAPQGSGGGEGGGPGQNGSGSGSSKKPAGGPPANPGAPSMMASSGPQGMGPPMMAGAH